MVGKIAEHPAPERKWLLIGFGVCGTLFTIPLLTMLAHAQGALAAAWMIVSGYTSINAVVKAELFPTKVRATAWVFPMRSRCRSSAGRRIRSPCGSSPWATKTGSTKKASAIGRHE